MTDADARAEPMPAYYARRGGRWAQWWTVLHPPYTAWHLSYVVIGAGLAPEVDWAELGVTVLAFFLAVGVAAHALDEVNDRPLRTTIPDRLLWAVAVVCLTGAVALGAVTISFAGPVLVVFVVLGVALVLGYNLELFGGLVHTDLGFAVAWGSFPVLVGFVAQAPPLTGSAASGAALATVAAGAVSYAQRCLSTPARDLRRRTAAVEGTLTRSDGSRRTLDQAALLAPLERTLRALSWAVPLLAGAVVVPHLHG